MIAMFDHVVIYIIYIHIICNQKPGEEENILKRNHGLKIGLGCHLHEANVAYLNLSSPASEEIVCKLPRDPPKRFTAFDGTMDDLDDMLNL